MKNKVYKSFSIIASAAFVLNLLATTPVGAQVPADVKARLEELRRQREELKMKLETERTSKERSEKATTTQQRDDAKKKAKEARQKAEEVRKRILLNLIDLQIKHFKKTGERVARMPNVTEALKAELAKSIQTAVADFEALKAKVQAAATRDQLKDLAVEIRDKFKSHRDLVKKTVDAIHASRLSQLIDKVDARLKEVEQKVAEAKAAGKDVAAAETKLTEAKTKLTEAKNLVSQNKLEQALELVKEVRKILGEIGESL